MLLCLQKETFPVVAIQFRILILTNARVESLFSNSLLTRKSRFSLQIQQQQKIEFDLRNTGLNSA